jgi:hypothetical protein
LEWATYTTQSLGYIKLTIDIVKWVALDIVFLDKLPYILVSPIYDRQVLLAIVTAIGFLLALIPIHSTYFRLVVAF